MKSLLRRRPSPALVISSIALFVSLSGVSYGVATGFIDSREIKNNEVRSLDIRNNEVRTRDLRNNEIRGIDIRNSTIQSRDIGLNQVTGEDVREDTLQKVPSAIVADSATSATTAGLAATAGSLSTLKLIPQTTVAEGAPPAILLTHGPLKVTGACLGPDTTAELRVETTETRSSASGDGASYPVLQPSDGPKAIQTVTDLAGDDRTIGHSALLASAPSGKAVSGLVSLIADRAAGASGECILHGHAVLNG